MERLSRNEILLILEKLDDRSLFNICKTNRYISHICNDPYFWRKRIEFYFPGALQFKSTNKSLKRFYLELVMCFKDIEDFALDDVLDKAASKGNIDMMKYAIFKGADEWDPAMWNAAYNGHKNIVEFLISKGAGRSLISLNNGMGAAAAGGHKDLVEYFISMGANDWNSGIQNATEANDLRLIKFFISKGGDTYPFNWDLGLYEAVIHGYYDLIDFFLSKGAKLSLGVITAEKNNPEILEYLLTKLPKF